MERSIGTVSRGIRAPIIREGDNLKEIVVDSVLYACKDNNIELNDRDVVAVTEAVVARAQGNYATTDQIAEDIRMKFKDNTVGVVFPILSRNRFSVCLKGIAKGAKKIVLLLSYPADEVGNHIVSEDDIDEAGVDPFRDSFNKDSFKKLFPDTVHYFTGIDYIDFYSEIISENGAEVEVVFSNKPEHILKYTKHILACDIHTRARTKRKLLSAGAEAVYCLDEILTKPVGKSGFNEDYGLLGSNKATEDIVKLFPRDCDKLVNGIQEELKARTGKNIEVMVYGDGAFKDPVGKIWELADPVVSPGYTKGLMGRPNELKIKYLADNQFSHLSGDELKIAIRKYMKTKAEDLKGNMESQGTTPRNITDLIGSLCDLTSGSGDKGTPIVLIQGYFDNYLDK